MALSGLDIYKLLPKTNCKECGYATCLAFAMALAQKKATLEACRHVTDEAKQSLESASQPPVRLVTVGAGERALSFGNETVMYRHEEKFHHAPAVAVSISDALRDEEIAARLKDIRGMSYERVGKTLGPQMICGDNGSGDPARFSAFLGMLAATNMPLAIRMSRETSLKTGLEKVGCLRKLVVIGANAELGRMLAAIDDKTLPVALPVTDIDSARAAVGQAKSAGLSELVINVTGRGLSGRVEALTIMRHAALKKNDRAFGYPLMVETEEREPLREVAEAATYVCKYASVILTSGLGKEQMFPLLVVREDIYSDPQKPVQVEPKIYEIGKVGPSSPVMVTTNFSITYFTVASEVESSKVPAYVICCNAEGMSVLTAWAAEKFTAESITGMIKKCGIESRVSHREVIIPGYVSVLSGKLEETSGWTVNVGPREASGIPLYLRGWKA